MQKNGKNKKVGIRVAAAVLALAIVAPMPGVFGTNAAAATSLDGIESIKQNKGRLSILEIVPEKNTGSIGYYVAGQEPIANWLQEVASITATENGTAAENRKTYADNLFTTLSSEGVGLMGSGSEVYPLVQTGAYAEYLPWDTQKPANTTKVVLKNLEETNVNGSFAMNNESGDFVENHTYSPVDKNGTYTEKLFVENALYYDYGQRTGSNLYYPVSFERVVLDSTNVESYKNTPLYVLKTNSDIPYYDYAGTLSDGEFIIDLDVNNANNDPNLENGFGYYVATVHMDTFPVSDPDDWAALELEAVDFNTVTVDSLVGTTLFVANEANEEGETGGEADADKVAYTPVLVYKNDENDCFKPDSKIVYYKLKANTAPDKYTGNYTYSYAAVLNPANPYREAVGNEKGTFKENAGYLYVGNEARKENVNYFTFTPGGTNAQKISYDMIHVTGGYTNNEWFKRYVLDIPADKTGDFRILTVDSKTPSDLNKYTGDVLKRYIAGFDLVVVSAGFYLNQKFEGSAGYNPGDPIKYRTDISAAVAAELRTKDRVVDVRINAASNSNIFALTDGKTSPAVARVATGDTYCDVYYFANGVTPNERSGLATNQFHTPFGFDSKTNPNKAPYEVVLEEIKYENELRSGGNLPALSEEISMATCIRYVVNTHRERNNKTSLKVLDVQPIARYDNTTEKLTVADVAKATSDKKSDRDAYARLDPGPLTVATVLSWMPSAMRSQFQTVKTVDGNSVEYYDITIDHMSTAALIGKIEDLVEQYDLIYIGADVSTNDALFKRLPKDMYYANIGAEEPVDGHLTGLLATDTPAVSSTARYSGNDLTPKKLKELVAFARDAHLPVIISDSLLTDGETRPVSTLSVDISSDAAKKELKASVKLNPGIDTNQVIYQWYSMSENGDATPVSSGTDSTIPATPGTYYCTVGVTVDTDTGEMTYYADSEQIRVWVEGKERSFNASSTTWTNGDMFQMGFYYSGNHDYFSASTTTDPGAPKLTANVSKVNSHIQDWSVYYKWYTTDDTANPILEGNEDVASKCPVTNDKGDPDCDRTYYCIARVTYSEGYWTPWVEYRSPDYKLGDNDIVKCAPVANTDGDTAEIPTYTPAGDVLDPTKIDRHSLMYEALDSVWNKKDENGKDVYPNVMAVGSIPRNQDTLVKYLNLSCPSIVWEVVWEVDANGNPKAKPLIPAEYKETTALGTGYGNVNQMNFTFHIENPTDPSPLTARYKCHFYIDQNADGLHKEDERIDAKIYEKDGDNWKSVKSGELKGDTVYRVSRTFSDPDQFSGCVPWKLEVVKVKNVDTDPDVHASEKGFSYIPPSRATVIKALQIQNGHTSNFGDGVNLQTNSNFTSLYGQLENANMYDIQIDVTDVNALNSMATTAYNNYLSNHHGCDVKDAVDAAVDAVFAGVDPNENDGLDEYQMIILGFGDLYMELNEYTAAAVVKFIDTDKAVLFTHDTTSYWNITKAVHDGNATLKGDNNNPYWGYYFNQVIRDKVGLDRYGVTNATAQGYGVAAGSPGKINPTEAVELSKANYTPAFVPYEPEELKQSAAETQGYTNSIIDKYKTSSGGSNKSTWEVSQVNRGQITEYPFELTESYEVNETHNQYYQLNMNTNEEEDDDIVVWYCMSGDRYADEVNDVTNAYYIYNRGNITYTGAGHFRDHSSTFSGDEAKLFVNTMVAAYRAAYGRPDVEFKTADGLNPSSMMLVPTELSEGTGTNDTIIAHDLTAYFMVEDTNLTASKSISVELYYESADGEVIESVDDTAKVVQWTPPEGKENWVYNVDTGRWISPTNLDSSTLYKMMIPNEILDVFKNKSTTETKIFLKATTTIKKGSSNSSFSDSDDLTLKKLGLLRLE